MVSPMLRLSNTALVKGPRFLIMNVSGLVMATLKGFSPTPGIQRNTNSPALKPLIVQFPSSSASRRVSSQWSFLSVTTCGTYSMTLPLLRGTSESSFIERKNCGQSCCLT